ncbi:MAG TPA: hypothetical protein VHO01_01090 [Jatrophihabitans sp.]|nr:hypothetical protein [Jatrophihabitans sp.]
MPEVVLTDPLCANAGAGAADDGLAEVEAAALLVAALLAGRLLDAGPEAAAFVAATLSVGAALLAALDQPAAGLAAAGPARQASDIAVPIRIAVPVAVARIKPLMCVPLELPDGHRRSHTCGHGSQR